MASKAILAAMVAASGLLTSCGGGPAGTSVFGPQTTVIITPSAGSTSGPTYTVTYSVSGTATGAQLTYSNEQGGTAQEVVTLPWRRVFVAAKGDFLYLSAQSNAAAASVTTQVFVGTALFRSTTSNGDFVIATASDACC